MLLVAVAAFPMVTALFIVALIGRTVEIVATLASVAQATVTARPSAARRCRVARCSARQVTSGGIARAIADKRTARCVDSECWATLYLLCLRTRTPVDDTATKTAAGSRVAVACRRLKNCAVLRLTDSRVCDEFAGAGDATRLL